MTRETVEVPVLSDVVRRLGVPLALATRANGFVFVSGTPPLDVATGRVVTGTFEEECAAALDALAHCLDAAGSALDKVVSVRVYLADMAGWDAFNRVYARCFPADPPSRTVLGVAALPMGFRIEIEAVALA
jgi:reactive intermediate/imine deaminase